MLLAVLRKDSVLVGRLHEMLPGSMGFVRRYLKVAFPVICNESLWALGMMVYSWIYAQVGTVDYLREIYQLDAKTIYEKARKAIARKNQ